MVLLITEFLDVYRSAAGVDKLQAKSNQLTVSVNKV